jgi:hypothetical protein
MSKVAIEINGVRYGLKIPEAQALKLVETLQGYWVGVRHHSLPGVKRHICMEAFEELLDHVADDASEEFKKKPVQPEAPSAQIIEAFKVNLTAFSDQNQKRTQEE